MDNQSNKNEKTAAYLAKNITSLRHKRNWSQAQLAKNASIPRSTLTHIESGTGNPSLTNLVRISAALGVGVEELLTRPRSDCALITADQVPVQMRSQGKVKMHKLMPDKVKGIEIDRLEFASEAIMGGHPHLSGTKEYLTVIHGAVAVQVAGESYLVSTGDVFAFPGNQAHSYRNPRKTPAVAISIVIPVPAST